MDARPTRLPADDPTTAAVDGLDEAQRLAVTTPSSLVAVIAGAGSGKTRVLTRRVAWRIAAGTAAGRHTLVLTFTREAAGELRRRLRRLGPGNEVTAGTFHSVMLAMLRQRATDHGRPPPQILTSRERLLGELVPGRAAAEVALEADWSAARAVPADQYAATAARAGRSTASPADLVQQHLVRYQQEKQRRGVIDINDVLGSALHLLERESDFADAVRWRFRHLLVDEAQDLNPVQHRIVDVLRTGNDDLYLVGDPAQAIYGFNGADPGLLIDVETRFPGIEIVRLPSNHRCTPQVVELGRFVLDRGGQPTEVRSVLPDGPAVTIHTAPDNVAEATLVSEIVAALDPSLARRSGVAVLARTNAQVPPLVAALESRGVPVKRRVDAPGTPLASAIGHAIRLGSAGQLRAWAHDAVAEPSPAGTEVTEAEHALAAVIVDFLREQPQGDGAALRAWLMTADPFGAQHRGGVELLTFHSAKGREWPVVVVTGLETGLVPHRSARTSVAVAEEARLLYVAATRSTDRLVLTRAERRGGYARRLTPWLDGFEFGEPPAIAPPDDLRTRRAERIDRERRVAEALIDWRGRAARRASIEPEQLCTVDQLKSIARERPRDAEDLVAATGLGRLTALAHIDEIVEVLRAANT
jgi:DNA helicase-2/ATP-dependent DNA helicase PcrA